MTDKKFLNPYEDVPNLQRLTTEIPETEWHYVKVLRPNGMGSHGTSQGTFNTTINLLWSKLIHELKSRNITDFSQREAFEHFVANCQIIGPECAVVNKADIIAIRVTKDDADAAEHERRYRELTEESESRGLLDRPIVKHLLGTAGPDDRGPASGVGSPAPDVANVQPVAKGRTRKKRNNLPGGIVDETSEGVK